MQCSREHVRFTPSAGPGSLFVLTPQARGWCEKHTHRWPHFSVSSRRKLRYCMQACVSFDGSMDGLLAVALMKNGEESGDAGLSVSEILQHLSHEDMAFFVFCGQLSRIRS